MQTVNTNFDHSLFCIYKDSSNISDLDRDKIRPDLWAFILRGSSYCRDKAGCNNGHCWASNTVAGEWCYTTRPNTYTFKLINCSADSDCHRCWRCIGQ